MSDIAINVANLSKQYHIGGLKQSETMAEAAWHTVTGPFRRTRKLLRGQHTGAAELDNVFWALRDVSFRVEEGEVVGIIGRNGAGKSTLLKILSRITYPTNGRIELYGRVGSLLEVGTGFHPELTGRENVYLNGAVLGMTRREIARRFDEIVAFSGVERFIDTPVKHYSSGMSVRLAFAVAAHLEPEILLVDEVLAVGDAEFQRKCLGRMSTIAGEGRTVLFVSHNMASIQNLCRRVILLEDGRCVADGPSDQVISRYLRYSPISNHTIDLFGLERVSSDFQPILRELAIENTDGIPTSTIQLGEGIVFRIRYQTDRPVDNARFGIIISSIGHVPLVFLQTQMQYGELGRIEKEGVLTCHVDNLPLMPGIYHLTLGCSAVGQGQLDLLEYCAELEVIEADFFGTGKLPPSTSRHGFFLVKARWDVPSLIAEPQC